MAPGSWWHVLSATMETTVWAFRGAVAVVSGKKRFSSWCCLPKFPPLNTDQRGLKR